MATSFRAEHIGSLLRPSELLLARGALMLKGVSHWRELRVREDGAILAGPRKAAPNWDWTW